jgi:hypothetical protein
VAFAIEMYFDDAADAAVRTVWSALEHREVVSAASGPVQNAQPHVSLAVFDDGEMQAVEQILLYRLPAVRRLPLTLASLGFFLTQEAVAFLGVVPTARLLKVSSLCPHLATLQTVYLRHKGAPRPRPNVAPTYPRRPRASRARPPQS